jgi:hypothetical protein
VKPADLLRTLQELYREKQALRNRHEASARAVSGYDFNNTYQYIIAREDTQLSWLRDAIAEMGGTVPEVENAPAGPGARDEGEAFRAEAEDLGRFVERWRPRIEAVTNARHRVMLSLLLGETLEQKRFFDQMVAGRTDLLGRRGAGMGTGGGVLPTRWVE